MAFNNARVRTEAGLRAVVAFLTIILTVSLQPVPSLAQGQSYDGQPIVSVEFVGLTTLTEETMEHYLLGGRLEPGQTRLDEAELNRRLFGLWERDLIDDLSFVVEPTNGGLRLKVLVEERPVMTSIDYVGIKRLNRSDILERIDRERIEVYESQPVRLGELERLKAAIEEMYREKGYRFAQVSYSLEPQGVGQMLGTFTIDEGDRVRISDIQFDGNTLFSDWRLRLAMRKTKESGMISRITKKDIYNPAKIDEDIEKLKDLYRRAGYKDILIAKPEIDVKAKRPEAPTIAEQKRRLVITVPVEEGDRWRQGDITIQGNEVFSDQVLLRQFEKPSGGWLRSKVVDDAMEKIEKLYNSFGYIFARFDTEYREREDGSGERVADIIVDVDEADQYRVGRIEFEGNSKTRDKVLRRELLVQEGSVMSMPGLQNSLLKIRQLNYFALNEDEPIQFDFDNENKTVDVLVQGEEAERTELQFGGGWSEFDGFFGQFALRTANFLGRGETLAVSAQSGRLRDVYSLEYQIPWFLDRPQNVGFSIFRNTFDSRVLSDIGFRRDISGASVTYGRRLGAFSSLSFTYGFSDIFDSQTLFNIDGDPVVQEFDFLLSTLRPFWSYNTIDSRFEPTRGLRLTAGLEIAGSFLGGDQEYLRPTVGLTWFKRMSRAPVPTSFGINVEAGYLRPLNDSEVFLQSFFFLGGESSVRGFRRRSIFPVGEDDLIARDPITRLPLGGDRSLQVNLEYHFLMGGPFRIIAFADAGGVFAESQSIDLNNMYYSAGIELRILVPVFGAPLRFIYASNLKPRPEDQFESFDFTIGTSF